MHNLLWKKVFKLRSPISILGGFDECYHILHTTYIGLMHLGFGNPFKSDFESDDFPSENRHIQHLSVRLSSFFNIEKYWFSLGDQMCVNGVPQTKLLKMHMGCTTLLVTITVSSSLYKAPCDVVPLPRHVVPYTNPAPSTEPGFIQSPWEYFEYFRKSRGTKHNGLRTIILPI